MTLAAKMAEEGGEGEHLSFARYTEPMSPAPRRWRKRMSARVSFPSDSGPD